MQQVDNNCADPLERVACLFDGRLEPSDLDHPDQRPGLKSNPGQTHRAFSGSDSAGPVEKPGFVRFLFTPEDTTGGERKTGWAAPVMEPRAAAGAIKAFFWIIMAILFCLMVAQLH